MRKLTGTVASDKMDKTVVVAVTSMKQHPKYHKSYKVTMRFKAHDEKNECKLGDTVIISATRPLSKGKRWEVIECKTKKITKSE